MGVKETEAKNKNTNDRYINTENIGMGANGTVYKAFDKLLNRYVAIKRVERDEKWAWKEAEILKTLKHLSIPVIYDVLKEEEKVSIVMEYMEGENMLSVLEKGEPFEEKRAVEVGIRIGECLQYLHNLPEKIIYRDLKPENLIIDAEDRVKLIDFDSAFVGRENGNEVIQTGTFGYSAPEQFEQQGMVDERSDIYGFGTTLYHMLTGKNPARPPYRIYKIREINPFISEELEQIIEKCMEQDKEKRYGSMEEILEELKNYQQKPQKKLKLKRNRRNKRYMVEETKNIFLTGKGRGGLLVAVIFAFVVEFFCKTGAFQSNLPFSLPKTVYAREIQEKDEILPLILYNAKREKIIIKEGIFYETDADFHMAIPFSVLEETNGIEVIVVCKNLENGKSMQKEVLLKAK